MISTKKLFVCDTLSSKNVWILSFAFFLVFSGFNGVSRFATSTTKYEKPREISLAIIYTIIPITTLLIGPIVINVKPKIVFFLSTFCYVLYISANIKVIPVILYICSVLVGISAPLLWISKQVYVNQCSNNHELYHNKPLNSQLGYFNGLFWMIFQFSACLGSLLGALLFELNGTVTYLYILFTFVCILGVFTFCCLKPMNNSHNITNSDKDIELDNMSDPALLNEQNTNDIESELQIQTQNNQLKPHIIIYENFKEFISIVKQFNCLCYIPMAIYTGLEIGFDAADFPELIKSNKLKFYVC